MRIGFGTVSPLPHKRPLFGDQIGTYKKSLVLENDFVVNDDNGKPVTLANAGDTVTFFPGILDGDVIHVGEINKQVFGIDFKDAKANGIKLAAADTNPPNAGGRLLETGGPYIP